MKANPNPNHDIEDFLSQRVRHIPPEGKVFYVENDRDYHERNEMQFYRELYGYAGTAYFSPVGFH